MKTRFFTLAAILVLVSSCKTINKDAMAAWTSGDQAMMQDLQDYRTAQGKPGDDLKAHLTKTFDQITPDEENSLMAELLADVKADQKKSDTRKASYQTRVQAHLNLFNSLKQ